jgi:hypothetical protein
VKFETALSNNRVPAPATQVNRCLGCGSRNVFEFDGDVFCTPCGWNSIEMRVDAQMEDQIRTFKQEQAKSLALPSLPSASEDSAECPAIDSPAQAIVA